MDRWRDKLAVVTGASAGIGASICEKLVQHGVKVIGLARRVDRVTALSKKLKDKPGQIYAVKCDIGNETEVENAFKWIENNLGLVSIVINNAGLFKIGTVIESRGSDLREVFDTNVLGACYCTRAGVSHMKRASGDGHIVLMNSVAGKLVITGSPPHNNLYSPSKHALTCLTEVLRRELAYAGCRVKVTNICPGYVDTDIFETAGKMKEPPKVPDPTLPTFLKPEDVADSVIYTLATPTHVQIYDLTILGTTYGH